LKIARPELQAIEIEVNNKKPDKYSLKESAADIKQKDGYLFIFFTVHVRRRYSLPHL